MGVEVGDNVVETSLCDEIDVFVTAVGVGLVIGEEPVDFKAEGETGIVVGPGETAGVFGIDLEDALDAGIGVGCALNRIQVEAVEGRIVGGSFAGPGAF